MPTEIPTAISKIVDLAPGKFTRKESQTIDPNTLQPKTVINETLNFEVPQGTNVTHLGNGKVQVHCETQAELDQFKTLAGSTLEEAGDPNIKSIEIQYSQAEKDAQTKQQAEAAIKQQAEENIKTKEDADRKALVDAEVTRLTP